MWALAAISAYENKLPLPSTSNVTWLQLAINVFNDQVQRWDTSTCGGGLKWQIFAFNSGYDYKNAISQSTFFQLAARLAVATNNQTYSDWATKAYNWSQSIGFIDENFAVYDGASDTINCSQINHLQWTENAGAFLYGSAVMYNFVSPMRNFKPMLRKLI
jgi:mannan endo-1,6-alpha-mannosidase